jgi:PAS domain S-box-containing protein
MDRINILNSVAPPISVYSILYVDDEPSLLELAKIYLERTHTFSIAIATSANEGLELLKKSHFDAIISDYAMPQIDGIEFLKTVRIAFGDIPFILFTGKGREEIAIEAFDNGADFYIQKGGQPKAQFHELAHKTKMAIDRKRADLSLRDSEQRYKAVVEDQTELISRFTPDMTYTFANDAFCRYFQKKHEEVIGGNFILQIPKDDLRNIWEQLAVLTPENPTVTNIFRIRMDEGVITWHRWTYRAIFDDKGSIREYQAVGQDITSQKETELELSINRDYLNLIFTSVQSGILVIDAKTHVIIDVNPAAVKMIGAAEDQIVRKVCHTFICPAEAGKCPVTDLGLSVDNSEWVLIRPNGEKKAIIKYVTKAKLNGRDCLLETFIDNTARKQIEDELQATYSQLAATEKELKKKIEELQISTDTRNLNDHGTGS